MGSNLLTCPRGQMWAPNLLKSATWRHNSLLKYVGSAQRRPEDLPPRSPPRSSLRGRTKVAKVGPLPGEGTGEGSNLLKCSRPLLPPPRPLTSTTPTDASTTGADAAPDVAPPDGFTWGATF